LLLCFAGALHGQIRSATITGSVTDASGAVVPNAAVAVTNQETSIKNVTKTTDAGLFTIPYLQAGKYTLSIDLAGFTPYRETGVTVETAQTVRVGVTLRVGTLESTVEVAAQAQQVQTDSATVQASTQSDLIAAIPNPDQNPLYYAMLQNGVVPRNATADTTSIASFGVGVNGRRQYSALGVNGGRAWTNDIQLDGLPIMGGGYNEASVVPNTEGSRKCVSSRTISAPNTATASRWFR
jgi:trimeric autotransporter adhesin